MDVRKVSWEKEFSHPSQTTAAGEFFRVLRSARCQDVNSPRRVSSANGIRNSPPLPL